MVNRPYTGGGNNIINNNSNYSSANFGGAGGWGGGFGGMGMGGWGLGGLGMGMGGWGMGLGGLGMGLGGLGMGLGMGMGMGGWGMGWGGWGGGWGMGMGGDGFLAGLGIGALSGWGMNALWDPGLGYNYGLGFDAMGVMPTWNAGTYSNWGLGGLANDWLFDGYANPYITPQTQTIVVQQPVAAAADAPATTGQFVAYDYSRPIDVTAVAPEPSVVDTAQQVFGSARDAFTAGDFTRALALADQAMVQIPNDSALHQFRALCLFALRRYEEAAAVIYTVLSAGPGWDWTTLVSLYPSVDVYTDQLRALETSVREHANDPARQFLLGYHYMVQGHTDAAGGRFQVVAQLQPQDQLSGRFAQVLNKAHQAQAQAQPSQPPQANVARAQSTPAPAQPAPANVSPAPAASGPASVQPAPATTASGATAPADQQAPPPPPTELAGLWKAQPGPGVTVTLKLAADGAFSWSVEEKGRTQSIEGLAGFQDGVLALNQEDGPPLVGKITRQGDKAFFFKPPGAPDSVKGLEFNRS
jgi:tetratricopeptide (TPR) repeat protein